VNFEQGGEKLLVRVATKRVAPSGEPAKAVVLFFPGIHGGVGPCRTPPRNYDENALFPTLAAYLADSGIASTYRICWERMCPPLWEAIGGGCLVAHQACSEQEGLTRIVLVGHSMGGAVATQVAHQLHNAILPQLNERRPVGEVAGVLTFASQLRGAQDAVPHLEGVPKLFVHGRHDAVVPSDSAEVLDRVAAPPSDHWIVEAGHDLYDAKAEVLAMAKEWLVRACTGRDPLDEESSVESADALSDGSAAPKES
jgi:predicted alpha/beta-hydrolase family hydrolase